LAFKLSLVKLTDIVAALEKGDNTLLQEEVSITKQANMAKKELNGKPGSSVKPWTDDEISLLSKALNKVPGGSRDRWEQIQLIVGTRTLKEVIAKGKEGKLVPSKPSDLYQVEDPYDRFNKIKKKADVEITSELSQRDDPPPQPVAPVVVVQNPPKDAEYGWTPEEQKTLEKSLQTFPASLTDRWDKIAATVGKPKKDCIQRYKYLVAKIKEKSMPTSPLLLTLRKSTRFSRTSRKLL